MRVKKNLHFLKVNLIALFSLLWLPPKKTKKILEVLLVKQLGFGTNITFTKSGRSALFILSSYLKSIGYKKALIPHRICNVVEMAVRKAQIEIFTYQNDEELEKLIIDSTLLNNEIPILLVATYFNDSINRAKIVDLFIRHFGENVPIIFDECQSIFDFSLFFKYKYIENKFLLLSFNDKYIPGLMGGAIINQGASAYKLKKMRTGQEIFFFLSYMQSLVYFIFHRIPSNLKSEFSSCRGFRYEIDNHEISYISAIIALRFLKIDSILSNTISNNYHIISKIPSKINKPMIYHLISTNTIKKTDKFPVKGPYLLREKEPIEEAIKNTGGIFLINSYKFRYYE